LVNLFILALAATSSNDLSVFVLVCYKIYRCSLISTLSSKIVFSATYCANFATEDTANLLRVEAAMFLTIKVVLFLIKFIAIVRT